MQVLGLDVGNGKVKCCWIQFEQQLAQSQIIWDSLPLPFSANRRQDFDLGLQTQILRFLDQHKLRHSELEQVVVCCSHSFSYPRYGESVAHLAEVLERFFAQQPVYLVRADGQLTAASEMAALPELARYAYVFTNFYGSALLGSRLIQNGLALDLGTTTLDIIPIQGGQIDPIGLARPADYLRYRYCQGRIHWLGLTVIPLPSLAERVHLNGEAYQVVARDYRTDLLLALLPTAAQALLRRHAYHGHLPSAEQARQQLPQLIGLDDVLLSEAEILALRDVLFERLIDKVAAEIRAVAQNCFEQPLESLEVAAFALGEELVLQPALERAGFDLRRVKHLDLGREQALWSASSVFAMALLALEQGLGQPVALN